MLLTLILRPFDGLMIESLPQEQTRGAATPSAVPALRASFSHSARTPDTYGHDSIAVAHGAAASPDRPAFARMCPRGARGVRRCRIGSGSPGTNRATDRRQRPLRAVDAQDDQGAKAPANREYGRRCPFRPFTARARVSRESRGR